MAVANLGVDAFEHWLPPYILGQDRALSYLVGGANLPTERGNNLHDISWKVQYVAGDINAYLVTVTVRLFGEFGGPHALIIVDRCTSEFVQASLMRNRQSA